MCKSIIIIFLNIGYLHNNIENDYKINKNSN